jgi:Fanconi-associated nuclease 1
MLLTDGHIKCMNGKCLSSICRLFCEDYATRGAGLPDLFLWNPKDGTCKFVEVKGPGDTLRENQKAISHSSASEKTEAERIDVQVWIDFLLRVGMPLEVCHVNESGNPEKKRKTKQADGANAKRRRNGKSSLEGQQA